MPHAPAQLPRNVFLVREPQSLRMDNVWPVMLHVPLAQAQGLTNVPTASKDLCLRQADVWNVMSLALSVLGPVLMSV